jgi:hypothetical protein
MLALVRSGSRWTVAGHPAPLALSGLVRSFGNLELKLQQVHNSGLSLQGGDEDQLQWRKLAQVDSCVPLQAAGMSTTTVVPAQCWCLLHATLAGLLGRSVLATIGLAPEMKAPAASKEP